MFELCTKAGGEFEGFGSLTLAGAEHAVCPPKTKAARRRLSNSKLDLDQAAINDGFDLRR
jgi:hypothetical protein